METVEDPEAGASITLVHERAPDARFGRFVSRPIPGQPDYRQVNRVEGHGLILTNGWTFLVNIRTRTVTRTVCDPNALDFKDAQKRGTAC
ncbi:MAG TPA: hypothetical protein VIW24_27900 [Aldersonia sp.]